MYGRRSMDALWMAAGALSGAAILIAGLLIGRSMQPQRSAGAVASAGAADFLTRAQLDEEVKTILRRIDVELDDWYEKLRLQSDRARIRQNMPSRKPQDALGDGAEASTIPFNAKARARDKARRRGLSLARSASLVSESEREEPRTS